LFVLRQLNPLKNSSRCNVEDAVSS
jgi:hypothetical protein